MNRPSKLAQEIRAAVEAGRLKPEFRVDDIKRACPGRSDGTYAAFLAKHVVDNAYGNREYFRRVGVGLYSLIERRERT